MVVCPPGPSPPHATLPMARRPSRTFYSSPGPLHGIPRGSVQAAPRPVWPRPPSDLCPPSAALVPSATTRCSAATCCSRHALQPWQEKGGSEQATCGRCRCTSVCMEPACRVPIYARLPPFQPLACSRAQAVLAALSVLLRVQTRATQCSLASTPVPCPSAPLLHARAPLQFAGHLYRAARMSAHTEQKGAAPKRPHRKATAVEGVRGEYGGGGGGRGQAAGMK